MFYAGARLRDTGGIPLGYDVCLEAGRHNTFPGKVSSLPARKIGRAVCNAGVRRRYTRVTVLRTKHVWFVLQIIEKIKAMAY